jgi:hypothetical protein
MPTPVEIAAEKYIAAAFERDPAARATLVEACCAADIRLVTRSGVIRGHAGIRAMLDRVHGDPQIAGIRMASVVDATGAIFRYRSFIQRGDGTELEFFDAGEIDADGKIVTLLVFSGALADAA